MCENLFHWHDYKFHICEKTLNGMTTPFHTCVIQCIFTHVKNISLVWLQIMCEKSFKCITNLFHMQNKYFTHMWNFKCDACPQVFTWSLLIFHMLFTHTSHSFQTHTPSAVSAVLSCGAVYCAVKMVLSFESVDETPKCDQSRESYWAILSCGAVSRGGGLLSKTGYNIQAVF